MNQPTAQNQRDVLVSMIKVREDKLLRETGEAVIEAPGVAQSLDALQADLERLSCRFQDLEARLSPALGPGYTLDSAVTPQGACPHADWIGTLRALTINMTTGVEALLNRLKL